MDITINGNVNIVGNLTEHSSVEFRDAAGHMMIKLGDVDGDIKQLDERRFQVGTQTIQCGEPVKTVVIGGNASYVFGGFTVVVNGNVEQVSTTSGDVSVSGNVGGSVSTKSGDIEINGNVGGSASTVSGDIDIKNNQP